MSEFRLHYDKPKPIKTAADVQAGLDIWREINSNPQRWAEFQALQFTYERIVTVRWGTINSDGTKECAIETIFLTLESDGNVYKTKIVHA